MKKLLLFALIFTIHVTGNADNAFSTLEERMSGKEFKETGLVKLSDAELAALNEWVRSHSVATLENAVARPAAAAAVTTSTTSSSRQAATHNPAAKDEDPRGFENRPVTGEERSSNNTVHSYIVGTFTGWQGNNNIFTLGNGMVWKQVEGDTFNVRPTENAEVTIKKSFMGAWRLSMVGYNNAVRVERIK